MQNEKPSQAQIEKIKKLITESYRGKTLFISGVVDSSTEEHKQIQHFEGRVSGTGQFKIEWYSGLGFVSGGIVYGDDSKGFLITRHVSKKGTIEDPASESNDPEISIGSSTGISGGSTYLLRSLQKGNFEPIFSDRISRSFFLTVSIFLLIFCK